MEKKSSEKKQKRITIRQVAERAGVTIGTVSHVINKTASISPETAERVKEAIEELHYVPNITARSLRSRKSKQIGFLIPNLNNTFYSRISSTFIDRAFENGFLVQILGYEYSLEKEMEAIDSLASNSVDIVVILNGCQDEAGITKLLDMRKKVILADRTSDLKGVKCIYFDNRTAMNDAVKLLKSKNYKRIGFLSEPIALTNVKERFHAFQDALKQYEYEFREDNVFICKNFQLDALVNGYQYVKELLRTRGKDDIPDAFIASSDLLAIGALKAFHEYGLSVPGDVGIIGYDNLDITSYMDPGLTTIEQNQVLFGTELFQLVKDISENREVPEKTVLSQKLIVRNSC